MTCGRCGNVTDTHILSYFNEDDICMSCQEKESKHPDYNKARKAEAKAIKDWSRRGSPKNFAGIGLPADLMVVAKVVA